MAALYTPGPSISEGTVDDGGRAMVWIGGIPSALAMDPAEGEAKLRDLLAPFGTVVHVTLRSKAGDNKSWALATFKVAAEAEAAVEAATVTHGGATMQIEQAKVQAHLQRSNTSALAGIYTEQLTRARDQKEAIGLMACRIATRSHRPLHEGTRNHSRAARRFQTLRARTMAIAAFGGFKQHTKRSERQVLVRAVRRLEGYARRSNLTLEELFDLLDKDGEGTIDVQEFRNGMTSVIGLCLDNETHQALMSYMDTDGSGELDAEEFCGKVTAVLHEESVTSSAVVARLYQHLTKSSSTIDAFLGEQATGMEQFREALDKIGIGLSEDEFAVVMKELDQDGDGQMHVKELSHSFSELERMRRVSALTVLGQVVDFVSRTKSSLNRIFASVDVDGSGTLDMFELQEALRKMQQDLSDFEVSNLMQELDLIGSAEDGSGLAAISCAQFLDKLKMYKSEREVDTVKCKSLFKRLDKDQSGCLDYQEVSQLAKEMGFGDKIDSDSGFVDTLMREIKAAHVGDEGLTLLRASARLDELLAWFLSTGRSYLPRHRYPAQPDLCNLDAQQLKELFAKLDVSGDGLITMDEACQAVSAIWPMLDETAIQIAFEAADHTHSGTISQAGLLLLLRCIIWLNEKRHQVDEVLTRFRSEGVGEGEFRLGCRVLGVLQASSDYSPREFDAIAREHFVAHTAALARDDKLVEFASQGYMSAAQFMVWAVQHATVPSEEKRTREEWATAELEASSGQYGDLFFEDLADILHRSTSLIRVGSKTYEQHTLSQALGKTNSVAVAKRAARGALERLHLLTKGVKDALTRLDSFPGFGDDVMRRLADQCTDDAFFSGQFIMTAGELGDDFVVLRRGMAEVVVDGTVVAEIREGQGVGEMSLLFGTRRNATVKCVGPCEVIVLTRASYQSEISRLPVDQRVGKLESILLKFWDLVAADTGMFNTTGTKQQTVPFSTYRKLHIRITKTLTMPEDEPDYDEEESREISTQDWAEDVKRYRLPADGSLTMTMYFDSLYQLVDLWASGVDVSFYKWLCELYDNIVNLVHDSASGISTIPRFKPMSEVRCRGDRFAQIKDEAELAAEGRHQKEEETAKQLRAKVEQAERQAEIHALHKLEQELHALDTEEAQIRDRLAAGGLPAAEQQRMRTRLSEIAQERRQIQMKILGLEQAALRQRLKEQLEGHQLSSRDEVFFGRDYAKSQHIDFERDSPANIERRLAEINGLMNSKLAWKAGGSTDRDGLSGGQQLGGEEEVTNSPGVGNSSVAWKLGGGDHTISRQLLGGSARDNEPSDRPEKSCKTGGNGADARLGLRHSGDAEDASTPSNLNGDEWKVGRAPEDRVRENSIWCQSDAADDQDRLAQMAMARGGEDMDPHEVSGPDSMVSSQQGVQSLGVDLSPEPAKRLHAEQVMILRAKIREMKHQELQILLRCGDAGAAAAHGRAGYLLRLGTGRAQPAGWEVRVAQRKLTAIQARRHELQRQALEHSKAAHCLLQEELAHASPPRARALRARANEILAQQAEMEVGSGVMGVADRESGEPQSQADSRAQLQGSAISAGGVKSRQRQSRQRLVRDSSASPIQPLRHQSREMFIADGVGGHRSVVLRRRPALDCGAHRVPQKLRHHQHEASSGGPSSLLEQSLESFEWHQEQNGRSYSLALESSSEIMRGSMWQGSHAAASRFGHEQRDRDPQRDHSFRNPNTVTQW